MTTYRIRRAMPSGAKHLCRYSGRPGFSMVTSLRQSWIKCEISRMVKTIKTTDVVGTIECLTRHRQGQEVVLLELVMHVRRPFGSRPGSPCRSGVAVCVGPQGGPCAPHLCIVRLANLIPSIYASKRSLVIGPVVPNSCNSCVVRLKLSASHPIFMAYNFFPNWFHPDIS